MSEPHDPDVDPEAVREAARLQAEADKATDAAFAADAKDAAPNVPPAPPLVPVPPPTQNLNPRPQKPPEAPPPETRWAASADAVPWVMTLGELVARGACTAGLERFDARTHGSGVWTLERGWTERTTEEIAWAAPESLLWYARRGLIPLTEAEAHAAIKDAQEYKRRPRSVHEHLLAQLPPKRSRHAKRLHAERAP